MATSELKRAKIVIVGAGFGGLGMAVALKTSGEDDFVILEKYATVGGVWRDNTYPGCTCDVPSHLYSFSFAPYQDRKQRFPPQQNILSYLQQVTEDHGIRQHLILETEVMEAHFHQDENVWDLKTAPNQYIRAETVIFAVGQLHKPKYPSGVENFKSPVFHSAEWNHGVDLRGKKISVIGTGSSAAQMLPKLASVSSQLAVYQTTPHWVLPKADENFGYLSRSLLSIPGAHQLYRSALSIGADLLLSPAMRSNVWSHMLEYYARYNLRRQVTDVTLLEKLTPKYRIGTKRILFDNTFYPTLALPHVSLKTSPIASIHATGIRTSDDDLKPTDVIICATGFRAAEFLQEIPVSGRDGHTLKQDWSQGAEAYLGLAIPHYPNLFMIAGPNSFNPAGSNPQMKEAQIAFIMKCLAWKRERGAKAVEVSTDAMAHYREWMEGQINRTVWQGSEVRSWYKHESGKIVNPWPASVRVFESMLRRGPEEAFIGTGMEGKVARCDSLTDVKDIV